MGTSSSPAELARKLFGAGDAIEKAGRAGLLAGGQKVKTAALLQLAAAGAGSGRMRGVGKSGARVGVSYDIIKSGEAVRVRMTGPAHLLERDTKAHTIGPKKRRGRAGRGGGVKLADGSVRRTVHHPGTRGKHPWEKALTLSLPLVGKTIQGQVAAALAKAFGG